MRIISERHAMSLLLFLLSPAVLFVGCGTDDGVDKLPLYGASGTVRMDGEPFGPVSLRFDPIVEYEENRGFVADADENGEFKFVTTYEIGDGAAAGTFTVSVFSSVGSNTSLPAVYERSVSTPLKVNIADITGEGANTLTIELDSSAGAPSKNSTTGHLTPEQFRPGITD